jgi:Big-like domain-containing protein
MKRRYAIPGFVLAIASAGACPDFGPNISGIPQIGLSAVRVTPNTDTILAADSTGAPGTTTFTATAYGRNGGAIASLKYVWTSSNGSVASVDSSGKVTAISPGTTIISASAGKIGHATLVVLPGLTIRPPVVGNIR